MLSVAIFHSRHPVNERALRCFFLVNTRLDGEDNILTLIHELFTIGFAQ